MRVTPGDRVDRYVLRARLGEGGQGEVWSAEDPLAPGEQRAIKLVPIARANSSHLERVRREARQLVQLQHASLVRCHGLFEDLHRELLGIVMEYVDGEALRGVVESQRFTPHLRFLLLAHVANALSYVHQRGVIHRDVKLENVLVTRAFWVTPEDPSTVKLIDFGIAIETTNPKPLTTIGTVVGTAPYFAPEQLEPEFWGGTSRGTPQSDVFAWGILAWKLLSADSSAHPTGLPPAASLGNYAVAYRRLAHGSWPPPAPEPTWSDVLARALALDPAKRTPDGLSLYQAVSTVSPGVVLRTAETTAPTPRVAAGNPTAYSGPRLHTSGTGVAPPGMTEHTGEPTVRTVRGPPPPVVMVPGAAPPPATRSGATTSNWVLPVVGGISLVALGVLVTVVAFIVHESSGSDAPLAAASATSPAEVLPTPTATSQPPVRTQAPRQSANDSACKDCSTPGTTCVAGVCRLAPGSRWKVSPFAIVRPNRLGSVRPPPYETCVRAAAGTEQSCARTLGKGFVGGDGKSLNHYFLGTIESVEVTQDDITMSGLDIRVTLKGLPNAVVIDRPYPDLVAGATLFKGGLSYKVQHPDIQRVHVKIEPAE